MILDMYNSIIWINSKDFAGNILAISKEIKEFNKKDYKHSSCLYIRRYGLELYLYSLNYGFYLVDGVKDKKTGEIFKSLIDFNHSGVYIFKDIDKILELDERLKLKFWDYIANNYTKFKENCIKIVFIGDLNTVTDEVRDLLINIDTKNQVNEIKDEIFNANKIKKSDRMRLINFNTAKILTLLNSKIKYYPNSSFLIPVKSEITFNEVGGVQDIEQYIEMYKKVYFKKINRLNLLLTGAAGVGKTITAKAIANSLDLPLYLVDMGKIFNSFLGKTEENIRKLWDEIKLISPAVILFDEIEKLLAGASSSNDSDAGTTARIMGYMLYQLQEHKIPAVIIGTVNNIKALPEEFFREERWDKIFTITTASKDYIKDVVRKYLIKNNIEFDEHSLDRIIHFLKLKGYMTGARIVNTLKDIIFRMVANEIPITAINIVGILENEISGGNDV